MTAKEKDILQELLRDVALLKEAKETQLKHNDAKIKHNDGVTKTLEKISSDSATTMEVISELKGGGKFMKWFTATTIAIGALVLAFMNYFKHN